MVVWRDRRRLMVVDFLLISDNRRLWRRRRRRSTAITHRTRPVRVIIRQLRDNTTASVRIIYAPPVCTPPPDFKTYAFSMPSFVPFRERRENTRRCSEILIRNIRHLAIRLTRHTHTRHFTHISNGKKLIKKKKETSIA